jgi:archaellum biogenesis ATPase FlaH
MNWRNRLRIVMFQIRKLAGPMGKLWNNGRMDSQPFLIGIVFLVLSQWHRHTVVPIEHVWVEASQLWIWPIMLSTGIILFAGRGNHKVLGAAIAALCLSAWMLAATGLGLTLPVLMLWLMLVLGAGTPFWLARAEYRVKITKARIVPKMDAPVIQAPPKEAFDQVTWLKGAKWAGPSIATMTGDFRRLQLPEGTNVRDFCRTRTAGMANVLRADPDDVELLEVPGSGHLVDIFTHRIDILSEPTEWPKLHDKIFNILDPVPIGLNRDGTIKYIDLCQKHLLVGGESGSGKSNIITMIVGTAVLDPNCQVFMMDGKRTELYPWRNLATAYVQDEMKDALALLKAIQDEMSRCQDQMNELGIRTFLDSDGEIKPKLLVIDELARYLRVEDRNQKQEFIKRLSDILDRGRSVGIMVVAVTQVPSKNLMTGDMKRGFTHRMALRMADTDGSEFVLESRIPDASKLPNDDDSKGYGYIRESGLPRKFRAFWVPDVHIRDMASRAFEPEITWETGGSTKLMITADSVVFPDGGEVPMSRQNLWDAVSDEEQTAKEISDTAQVTPQAAKKILDEWATKEYIQKGKRGNATTYYR